MASRFIPFHAHLLIVSRIAPRNYPLQGTLKITSKINPGFLLVDNLISVAKRLFPDGAIEQNSQNIYISKLGLPGFISAEKNSLESIVAAILNYRVATGQAGEAKIKYKVTGERISGNFIYNTITETFYQPVIENDYEINDYDSNLNPNKF